MRAVFDSFLDRVLVRTDIDPIELGSRCHQFADRTFRQSNNAGQNLMLIFFDCARACRIREDHVKFLCGHRGLPAWPHPQQSNQQARGCVQHPDQWGSNCRHKCHWARHRNCNWHGMPQGKLFRDKLTDHQAKVCGQGNHQSKAGIASPIRRNTKRCQSLANRLTQAGAGIGTCDDANQSNPDLHSRQKFAGVSGQLQRDLGAIGPFVPFGI